MFKSGERRKCVTSNASTASFRHHLKVTHAHSSPTRQPLLWELNSNTLGAVKAA
jgi:hypothetical protein